MRIAIVNDSAMTTEALRRTVVATGEHVVAWTAADGAQAADRCRSDVPDLILMDLVMPLVDGLEATKRIMADSPCPILLVTAHLGSQPGKVFEALGAGALDVIDTPPLGQKGGADALLQKIGMLGRLTRSGGTSPPPLHAERVLPRKGPATSPLVCIGASAGGPAALATILAMLPASLDATVVIVQHIDEQFANGLALWLASLSALPVRLIRDGDAAQRGIIYVAATNDHLILRDADTFGYTPDPVALEFRPSVDVFFESVLRHRPDRLVGALLTGMGRDGAAGLRAFRDAGAFTIAQDKATSIVYGMPRAAKDLDAAMEIVPLGAVAGRIVEAVRAMSRPR